MALGGPPIYPGILAFPPGCHECQMLRQQVRCDACALKERKCSTCKQPATRWVDAGDKYSYQQLAFCDQEECLPFITAGNQVYWKA